MKRIAITAIVLLAATAAFPQEKTDTTKTDTTAPSSKPADSPLVRAAKASGGPKKIPKKKVITNADVKKSRGKLVVLPDKKAAPAPAPAAAATAPAPPATSTKGPFERYEDQLRAENAARDRVAKAEKTVSDLEKELRRLEEAYYAENDPTYRDTTISTRFSQTKRQLEDARKDLADARDAQEKLAGRRPSS